MAVGSGVAISGLVHEALCKTGLASLRELTVEESDEVVVVSGSVPSYYCKQVAQETALAAAQGRRIVFRICVNPPSTMQTPNEP